MIIITENEKYLVSLLSSAIRNTEPKAPEENIDWEKLFLIAESQKVHTLIYYAIYRLPNQYKPALDLLEHWRKITMLSAFDFAKQAQQLDTVAKAFENEKVQIIFLKGAVLRDLYPIPELRTMSDFDVIVYKSEREKIKKIFSNLGYATISDLPNTMEFKKNGLIKFEVFFEVFTTIKIDNQAFTANLWSNAVPFKNNMTYVLKFKTEDFLLHLISHLAKHLKSRGAGVRNLCDLVLYIEAYSEDIDWDYITEKINSFGLQKFFTVLLIILHKNFDMQLIGEISDTEDNNKYADELLKHMLSHGVYGISFEKNIYLPYIKKIYPSKTKMYIECLHQAFPPIKMLSHKYGYAKKFPILLPIAWIHRLLWIRFSLNVSITDAVNQIQSSHHDVKTQNELLENLDLL